MNDRNVSICVFHCCNSMGAEEMSSLLRQVDGVDLKIIGLPCSGKIDVPYLMKAFETGSDGVVIVTCRANACQHLEGNMRARRRADAVISLLEEIGTEGSRVAVVSPKEEGDEEIVRCLSDLRAGLSRLGKLSA